MTEASVTEAKAKPRIAIGGFHHETNTFAPTRATYADFVAPDAWPGLTRGEAVFAAFAGLNIGISGAIEELDHNSVSMVPLLWANAGPSAQVERDAYERVAGTLLEDLRAALPVDGVYLCLHGAMVAEHLEDGEGELLRRVREAVGPDVPVVASLDFHANVTAAMVGEADALAAYRSYPHLDMAATGARAARLLLERIARGRPFAKAFRKLDFLIPLTWQCTLIDPAKAVYERLAALEGGAVDCLSFTPGFPPADIRECGPAVFAYGSEQKAVDAAAAALVREIEARRAGFAGKIWGVEEAVAHAIERARGAMKPVILADTQDNPGAGADADGVAILAALVKQGAEGAAFGVLYDPKAAEAAHSAGEGATVALRLGRNAAEYDQSPLIGPFAVERLSDGDFAATGPFYRGSRIRLGPMALLRIGGVRVVVASRKQQAADQAMFSHLGLEPAAQKILVLKSSVHFRADFQDLAEEVLVVAAPGPNIADPAALPYRHLRPGVRLGPNGPAFAG